MTTILWIGFGFLLFLLLFLTITFFKKDLSQSQHNTLRFLTALCAAFAGGFIAGDALFKLNTEISNGTTIAISGTAGCALFFTVWFTYSKFSPAIPEDCFNFSIPTGWTFQDTVDRIVTASQGVYEFKGFTTSELNLVLDSRELKTSSEIEAIKRLKYLCKGLPDYDITVNNGIYIIKVK